MPPVLRSGLPDVRLEPGDHICVFYTGTEERDTVLGPYLNAALDAGDKCVCIVEEADPPSLLREIDAGTGEVDVDDCIESGQLELASAATSYLAGGTFSTKDIMSSGVTTAMRRSAPTAQAGSISLATQATRPAWSA
jgi:MEDS: MEthanogen/methylotroph, DcmR Sensory domain